MASSSVPMDHISHHPCWLFPWTDRCQPHPTVIKHFGITTTTALLLPWGSSEHHKPTFTPKGIRVWLPVVLLRLTSEGYRYPAGIPQGNSGEQTVINRAGTRLHLTDVEMHLERRKRRREGGKSRRAAMPTQGPSPHTQGGFGELQWLPKGAGKCVAMLSSSS